MVVHVVGVAVAAVTVFVVVLATFAIWRCRSKVLRVILHMLLYLLLSITKQYETEKGTAQGAQGQCSGVYSCCPSRHYFSKVKHGQLDHNFVHENAAILDR